MIMLYWQYSGSGTCSASIFLFQVNVPSLQSRLWHCAAAFPLSPAIVEIVISGGATDSAKPNFTHLRFGKLSQVDYLRAEGT